MCGIAGEFLVPRADPERVRRMGEALASRGPDGEGAYVSPCGRVAFAHRRLAIRDPSAAGAQPMASEDGRVVLVFNGAIANDEELRGELERVGHRFRSRSDSEVLLRAYLEWGDACLGRLRGFFAFAVWDGRAERMLLARDRFGEKPLYYRWGEEGLRFASDLRAFRAAEGGGLRLDPLSVRAYLLYGFVPAPHAVFDDVRKLRPGHYLAVGPGAVVERPYWRLPDDTADVSPGEAARRTADLLSEAVRLRLRSDAPVSLLLSGGVDSSAVASFLGEVAPRVSAVTVGFGRPGDGEVARRVAERFSLGGWRQAAMGPGDVEVQAAAALAAYDEPLGSSAALSTLLLCREAARHGKVALGGEGGDELFLGYGRYRAFARWRAWRAIVSRAASGDLGERPGVARLALDPLARYRSLLCPAFGEADADALLGRTDAGAWEERDPFLLHDAPGADPLRRAQRLDLAVVLPDALLAKADRAGMAAGLEVRLPFLDHVLAEFVLRLPTGVLAPHGEAKGLLRAALRGRVPDEVLDGPKEGFSLPFLESADPGVRESLPALLRDAAIPGFDAGAAAHLIRGEGERARARRWMLQVLARWWLAWRP